MMGNELCVAFNQLYEVSLLQILGVPTTYVSLFPVVSGPVTVLLLILLGHYSDRGSRHRQRKIAVNVFASVILATAVAVLITADLLLLSQDDSRPIERNDNIVKNFSSSTVAQVFDQQADSSRATDSANSSHYDDISLKENSTDTGFSENGEDLRSMPLTAVLGIVGFCLMDMGYDVSLAAARACVLACSPRDDHTSILVLSLVMAAVGGCVNHGLGLVDLPQAFGFDTGNR